MATSKGTEKYRLLIDAYVDKSKYDLDNLSEDDIEELLALRKEIPSKCDIYYISKCRRYDSRLGIKNIYEFIYLEEFGNKASNILEFAYEYFKLFPRDILWNCEDWAFTKNDIEKQYIKEEQEEFWIYNRPDNLEELEKLSK